MPSFNNRMTENYKISGKLHIEAEREKHLKALANIKPLIDTSPPKSREKYYNIHKEKLMKSPRTSHTTKGVSFAETEQQQRRSSALVPDLNKMRSRSMSTGAILSNKLSDEELVEAIKAIQSTQKNNNSTSKISIDLDNYDIQQLSA